MDLKLVSYNKKSFIILSSFAFFLMHNLNAAFALPEVVRATTVSEKKINAKSTDFDFTQYDLYDFDEFSKPLDSNQPKVIKGFNVFKKRKNKINEDSVDNADEINEEPLTEDNTEDFTDNSKNEKNSENITQDSEKKQEIAETLVLKTQNEQPKQQVKIDNKNKFFINANKVTYDDTDGNVYANGNVEIISKAQQVTLKADNAVLDKEKQQIFLEGNVRIIKAPATMVGQSMVIDLNEENILMDNPALNIYQFTITGQEGYLIANDIELLNGSFKRNSKSNFVYMTKGFSHMDNMSRNAFFGTMDFDDDSQSSDDKVGISDTSVELEKKKTYRINAKQIEITSYKDHYSVLLKDSDVYYNNHKIIRKSDFEIVSDRQKQVVEANIPELANIRGFGSYLGYGLVSKMPKGGIFKIMPVLTYYESDTGVGVIGRYRSRNGILDAGWNTASSELVVRGHHKFTDTLSLNYGRHSYIPEGFMGARRSGLAAQIQYMQSYNIKDLNARFSNAIYAGVFSDYTKGDQSEELSTTRFRYMAQLSKTLFKYKNLEQGYIVQVAANAQGAATVYGTGETHGIVRIGPNVTTRLKRWESNIGYFLSGEHGESAFNFDRYRYGKSTITMNEKFYFSDKFALGFRLFITPMRDNYQDKLLTESRFYAIIGPKDLKVALSYDFIRSMARMDFMFIVGSDSSKIDFDKLITKDIDDKNQRRDFYKYAKPVRIEKPENI